MILKKYKSYEPAISEMELQAIEEGRELLRRARAGEKIPGINA